VPPEKQIKDWALAPEGMYFQQLALPQRLKPRSVHNLHGTAEAVPFQSGGFLYRLLEPVRIAIYMRKDGIPFTRNSYRGRSVSGPEVMGTLRWISESSLSYFGHSGKPVPLGSPVLAKLVQ
jgi:hypothetical protein